MTSVLSRPLPLSGNKPKYGMKRYIQLVAAVLFVFAFAKAYSTPMQSPDNAKFISHQVAQGETVYSISKKYKVSEKEIYKLNPDTKERIYEGLVLILPNRNSTGGSVIQVPQDDLTFKTHKVRRKETLFSISQKYNVPVDIIKKYNKQLYSKPLRKGKKIRIPVNYQEVLAQQQQPEEPVLPPNSQIYIVKAQETRYGIARNYGITIAQLEALNPGMGSGLKIGQAIIVPDTAPIEETSVDLTKHELYEVQEGDTMYSLLRRLNMDADALLALNPALDDGLKLGMILKIPRREEGTSTDAGALTEVGSMGKASLADSIAYPSTKKIAIMLPFGLSGIENDSTITRTDMIKKSRLLRIALDFHSGALMAIDKADAIGIPATVAVYDTDYIRADGAAVNARKVERLITSQDFSDVDVVIGPILGNNVNRAASVLERQNVPLISPITSRIKMGRNIFQSRPNDETLINKMIEFLKKEGEGKQVIIIADKEHAGRKSKLKNIFPNAKEVIPRVSEDGDYFLYPDDIPNQITKGTEHWVILETNDLPLISHATTRLNALSQDTPITLLTCKRGSAYDSDEIQHNHLMNLNFHYPSIKRESVSKETEAFFDAYEERYGVTPSSHAVRGYDLTLDILLRLAYADNLYDAAMTGIETDYIENKFRYERSGSGGYMNKAVYLVKYGPDLSIEEVLLTDDTPEDTAPTDNKD